MTDLPALLERIKAADGPSRELDAEIFIRFTPGVADAGRIDRDHGVVGWWPRDNGYQAAREVPSYTYSIDTALALVERMLPPHWVRMDVWYDGSKVSAAITPKPAPNATFGGYGATPALAILAALVSAIIAQGDQK